MNDTRTASCLLTSRRPGDAAPVLRQVDLQGRVDGILFDWRLRQTYCNDSADVLEVVYTFPLQPAATLLGFAAEIGGRRLEAEVIARQQAEARYEEALAEGDAPVLLERAAGGLHTANIGNLKPGETIVVELHAVELVTLDQGRLRLAIPTTIAPRYGDARRAGLQPQQVPSIALDVDYPLRLELVVAGDLARGVIACPSHAAVVTPGPEGATLRLAEGASLDRDVVVTLTPREPQPGYVATAADTRSADAPQVAVAALQLPPLRQREHIVLKLLVDCSGSMAGDSIASARRALRSLIEALTPQDRVTLTRFGSSVVHELGDSQPAGDVRSRLLGSVDRADADLGGTEMEQALRAVFRLGSPRRDEPADVLLVTDAHVWHSREIVAAARSSGHRIFVIVVGSAPSHGTGEDIASATGGACEYAIPGESLEQAALRMLRRIRQRSATGLRIDWGAEPRWQTPLPQQAFGGDVVVAYAGFATPPTKRPRLLLPVTGESRLLAQADAAVRLGGDVLARRAADVRLATAEPDAARQLALDYGLLSGYTHAVLVHERAAADKVHVVPRLQRVESMLAAGWGGTGAAGMGTAGMGTAGMALDMFEPMLMASRSSDKPAQLFAPSEDVPVALAGLTSEPRISFRRVAALYVRRLDGHRIALAVCDFVAAGEVRLLRIEEPWPMHETGLLAMLLCELRDSHRLAPDECWRVLAWWIARRIGWEPAASATGQPVDLLAGIPTDRREPALALLDERLGHVDLGPVPQPAGREQRLADAMGGD